jgi:ATP-dependent RNA helicase DeaD
MKNFKDLGLTLDVIKNLDLLNFKEPTPIQHEAIPIALQGLDILGTAQTGTGKTGAYSIPLISKILTDNEVHGLIMLPTRELAAQVYKAVKEFTGRQNINLALLIGGEEMGKQYKQLKSSPRIVIGTPGRINDHLERRTLKLDKTNFVVLDEVDRMLDMGFGIQLEEIMKHIKKAKQTLMFSATLPNEITKLAAKYLRDPVRISMGSTRATAQNLKQSHVKVLDSEKYPRLIQEISDRKGSIIVFVKTKRSADEMARKLKDASIYAEALHGDLRQTRRNKVVESFRKQKYRILVATDVAARGLDIPHIEHVINYDLPQCPEDYIHRIGRTARAGAEGNALSFLSNADNAKWRAIQILLNPDAVQPSNNPGTKKKSDFSPFKKKAAGGKVPFWQLKKKRFA